MNKVFFDLYRNIYGKLNQEQVDGLQFLSTKLMIDKQITLAQKAYILATVKHETADTYQPIREYGRGRGRKYGKKDLITGHAYYGRGYVQLTWKRNYREMGDLLSMDLVKNPDLVLRPQVSYEILVLGMRLGKFTGKSLDDYINDYVTDFHKARRIVNGMDKAGLIANYAEDFLEILKQVRLNA